MKGRRESMDFWMGEGGMIDEERENMHKTWYISV